MPKAAPSFETPPRRLRRPEEVIEQRLAKAAHTVGFAGRRGSLPVVGTLVLLAGAALWIGFLFTRH